MAHQRVIAPMVLFALLCTGGINSWSQTQSPQDMQLAGGDADEACPWEVLSPGAACLLPSISATPAIEPPVELPTRPESIIAHWDEKATKRGIDPHMSLRTEVTAALFGSKGPLRVDARNLLEISTAVDLERMAGWKGSRLFASMHSLAGGNGSDEILLDLQGYSNINAPSGTNLYELWFEQTLRNGKLRLKIGRIDANTEFAYVENAAGFLNSSMGYSPAIASLPTYPYPRLGVAIFLRPKSFYYLNEGVFEDSPDGMMSLTEAGLRWKWFARDARLAYGYWFHTESYPLEGAQAQHGAQGDYVVAEQQFWVQEELAGGAARGIAGFFQYGSADPWAAKMDRHLGFGLQWTGPWRRRSFDVVGIGASMVHLNPPLNSAEELTYDHERNFEGFYRVQASRWLSLTFDGQLINRPHGDVNCALTMAGSLRSTIAF